MKRTTRLSSGDVIRLYINDEFLPQPVVPRQKAAAPPAAGRAIYQDENIAVLAQARPPAVRHSDRTDANLVDAFCASCRPAAKNMTQG